MKRIALTLALGFALGSQLIASTLHRDVEYGQAGGVKLMCDVSVPDGAGPFPVAVLVHGGGWSGGDKTGSDHPGNGADVTPWFAAFTAANFTWISINYRLAPIHRWPAGLEDVQTAIRWTKAHAPAYHGDPTKIALVGHSSGGHLVCLAATVAEADTRVQAVIGFAAVTDLEADSQRRGGLSTSLQKLLDRPQGVTPETLAVLRDLSPINHVHVGLPPFLLLHGDADKTVPYAQSIAFQNRLQAAGNHCDIITLPGAPHGLLTWEKFKPNYARQMTDWLDHTLSRRPGPLQL